MLKPETIAFLGARLSFAEEPFNTPTARSGIMGQDGSGGTVSEQTSADENAKIVIVRSSRKANIKMCYSR